MKMPTNKEFCHALSQSPTIVRDLLQEKVEYIQELENKAFEKHNQYISLSNGFTEFAKEHGLIREYFDFLRKKGL